MSIHDATMVFTPSIDYEIHTGWGIQSLKGLQEATNLSVKDLIKRAVFLNINGGKEKKMSLEDMEKLSRLIADTKCCMQEIVKAFPEKKISTLYLTIEGVQKLSGVEKKKDIAKNLLVNHWTEKENSILNHYILSPGEGYGVLFKKLPGRTTSAIRQRLNKMKKKLPKVEENTIKHNPSFINPLPEPILPVEVNQLQCIKEDIMETIDSFLKFYKNVLSSSRQYEYNGLTISLNILKRID
jgi:hypothetical protein